MNDPNDPTIVVTEFMPEKISVKAGTKVSWSWSGTEPHSVTFNPDRKAPPPGPPDDALFAPAPGDVNASGTLVNSGLVPLGPGPAPAFSQTFSTPGSYQYFCVIHPGMIGTVDVSASASDTPADVAARAKKEGDAWLAEGQAAKNKLKDAAPRSERAPDGSSTWSVEMGSTTEHTDILAFAPIPVTVKSGDTVTFVNNSGAPHTATFAGAQQLPRDPTGPDANNPKPGPSPQTLNKTDLFNSGVLPPNAPPGAVPEPVRSFSFKVPAVGQYPFVCILHVSSNMIGTVAAT
ncbi:MAG: plastocyanin/azurin family copper-binding protein [Acidimicrobiales bacterium]